MTGAIAAPRLNPATGPLLLAAALVLTTIAYPLTSGAGRTTVSWTIVFLGAASSVVGAAGRSARTGVLVPTVVVVLSVGFEAVGLATDVPFGEYAYADDLGPTLLGVPLLVPLAWLLMAWPSWVLAQRLAPGRRLLRIGTATYLLAGWDVLLDPQLVQAGFWSWAHPNPGLPGIGTVPLTNLAGWLLTGAVLMTALDRVLARAPRTGPGDPAALLVLGWMTLGGAVAHAGWLGLPGSAVWELLLAAPVLVALGLRLRR